MVDVTPRAGRILTFYSYKGGTGRSMALANVAVLFTRWGYKTLVLDWDLEAPGLETFFESYTPQGALPRREGVADILFQFLDASESFVGFDSDTTLANMSTFAEQVSTRYVRRIELQETRDPLYMIGSGLKDKEYSRRVRTFDFEDFYVKHHGAYFIDCLRSEWRRKYDIILVDSRTGITDIAGICTTILPDLLVVVFIPTRQSIAGSREISEIAIERSADLPFDRRKLLIFPLASRFDTDREYEQSKRWLALCTTEFSSITSDWLPGDRTVDLSDVIEVTKLPYKPYFSFGERLAVMEDKRALDPAGLAYSYNTVAALLGYDLNNVTQLLSNRDEYIRIALSSPNISNKLAVSYEPRPQRSDKKRQKVTGALYPQSFCRAFLR